MDEQQLRALARLVDRQSAARAGRVTNAVAQLDAQWSRFDGWYDDGLVAELAAASAVTVQSARQIAADTTAAYIAQTLTIMREQPHDATRVPLAATRGETPLAAVYTRPAKRFRYQLSQGATREVALEAARRQASTSVGTDVMLAVRDSAQASYTDHGVRTYRRVIHPERAKTGTCGLCAVASDQTYYRGDLLPIHGRCGCETLPITSAGDPGRDLNESELKDLYGRAGSTSGRALKKIRYQVHDHGELGPVLALEKHSFRGQNAAVREAIENAEQLVADIA